MPHFSNNNNLFSLEGKTALLTGGSSGIGAAIAIGLLKADAKIAIFDVNVSDKLPSKIKFYSVNVSNKDELEETFKMFLDDYSGIDILINNAAITVPGKSEDYPSDDWFRTLDTNLSAVFFLSKLVGKQMIKQNKGGSIINITSIDASQGFPNNPAYCSTKGGVRQLSKALAHDWGKYGIRVNNLVPGYTHTPMNQKSWEDNNLCQERASHTMLGRWAEPEDMVGPPIFLASDVSSYVTGSDLYVDGGWNAKGI